MIEEALGIAVAAHAGQVDKQGVPYISHVLHVATRASTQGKDFSEIHFIVGLLHDVVEDTPITIEFIKEHFTEEITAAVEAITHLHGESLYDYIQRVVTNPIAASVKFADVQHNEERLYQIKDSAIRKRLINKYHLTRFYMHGGAEQRVIKD